MHVKDPQSMSEFGGLRKHEKTQHALVRQGSAALAAAVALPKFPERIYKVYTIKIIKI